MNKKIRNVLKVLGCIILSSSMFLSACRPKKEPSTKKLTRRTTEETTETTEEPTDTTDTSDTAVPTDTSAPSNKKYTGAEAGAKLHELDEEIFKNGKKDIISMVFDIEDPTKLGMDWPDVGIEPWSPSDEQENLKSVEQALATLNDIDFDSLELEDKILYDTLVHDYTLAKEMSGMDYYTSSMNSLTGENMELPIIFATLNFDDQADVERYLKMLADVKPYFESIFEYEKKMAEAGNSRPDNILDTLIESIDAICKDHEGNYMYTTFEDRVNAMDLDDAVKKDLIAKNKEILDTSFYPGYEELKKNMETLRGTAKTSGKICEMQGGKEFYEKYFQLRSGTNMTIDEAKKMLLDDINAKYTDFYSKLLKLNQQQNDELMKHMSQDPSVAITTGSFEKDVEFCKEAIKSDFPDIGEVKYTIYHIPEALSKNLSPAAYMSTPVDDINKNVLMLNDHSDGLGDMLTTVAHEAFPGHLFEAVYHMQHMNNFYQKGGTTAYKEGWSTYSEDYIMNLTTDYDLQVYECFDTYIALLNYQMQAYLDICVHYDGWGKDDVVKFVDQYFPGGGNQLADAFYDRIIEIPCYVTPYCFGNMCCSKIINDAMAQYGNQYSKSEIHAAYLDMGPSSFDILEKYMPQYVEKQH